MIAAATTTGCEAVHPGYGFLAENPAFVEACEDNDLVFVGPGADVMARMGDKAQAKAELKAAGVPLVPGHGGRDRLAERARPRAGELGYPGAAEGDARAAAARACGSCTSRTSSRARTRPRRPRRRRPSATAALYLEKAIAPARHVEIQVLCDAQGGVLTLGERECSIQRRHQKLIEESPSPALDADDARGDGGGRRAGLPRDRLPQRRHVRVPARPRRVVLLHRAERPAPGRAPGHRARDRDRHRARAAARSPPGEPLARHRAARRAAGHAIEVRINAEDPRARLRAGAGHDRRASAPPLGPGVRLDTCVEEGADVPPYYDSLLAKLIVWDEDRPAAIARALRALGELEVEGVPTTRDARDRRSSRSDEFRSGDYSTSYLDGGARSSALGS